MTFKIGDRVRWTRSKNNFQNAVITGRDDFYDYVIEQNGDETYAMTDELALLPKLKVGDKVRVLHTDYSDVIPVGTVTHIVHADDDDDASLWCEEYPQGLFFYASEFAPAADIDRKFNVGDRVRMITKSGGINADVGAEGNVGPRGEISSRYLDIVWDKDTLGGTLQMDGGYHINDFVKVNVPALKLEEGKFYRTRDGRKVGPMTKWSDTVEHSWCAGSRDAIYRPDGTTAYTGDDLIAEWVDEPRRYTSCPSAEVDNQRDEYGPPDAPAIVARLDNGEPRPNPRPFVHANRALAAREAHRLANKMPGKEFAVFEFVSLATVPVVYQHEWQRLAAAGQKIAAIKDLRGVAGLDLVSAKRAVERFLEAA